MNTFNKINEKVSRHRWTICALLFFATTVNYLDRQVLSLLQPLLAEQFGWTNSDYADIAAVFQFTYAIAMLFAGKFIDWMGTRKGYAWAITLWSVGAIIHAFAVGIGGVVSPVLSLVGIILPFSVVGFMFGRFVLAIGEAGNFPAAIKTVAEWFPKKERSFATGIFNSGANIGAILAPLTVPWIASHLGWEAAFIIVGGIGFLWLIFWFLFYDSPKNMLKKGKITQSEYDHIHSDKEEQAIENGSEKSEKVSWFKLLTFRQTWSFFMGKFITDGVWWFFLFWLPAYLKVQYGIEGTAIMLPLTVLYSMTMVGSIGGGWFPAHFMKKGMDAYKARMTAMFIIALFPLTVLAAQPLGSISMWFPVVIIGIGASAHQAWSANIFTTVSDMFPKKAVASVTGIGGMAGGMGGVIITKVAGALFDHYQALGQIETGYSIMFTFCALAYVIAWVVMKTLVPKFKPITEL
ncbi:MFS transporter [Prevotella sp. 10(H)]|uniref:MFS transporter n=1 Tax=Prevotella sp. 10(H) TaxID=1158294 RepID=UPI000ABD1C3C|nr:MFS transporter [Prevotella sp. 10(H)]